MALDHLVFAQLPAPYEVDSVRSDVAVFVGHSTGRTRLFRAGFYPVAKKGLHLAFNWRGVQLSERTIAGLERARAAGRVGGRPKAEDDFKTVKALRRLREEGKSIRQIASELGICANTVMKVLKAA